MIFKTTFLSFLLMSTIPFSASYASMRNLCDDMVESGKSTDDQIKKCLAKFGESETYKENILRKKQQEEESRIKNDQESAKKANIEVKKFSQIELEEAGFGKAFFAIRVDYSNKRKPKEKRITEGDALCKYLGFEKVLKSVVSAEILPDDADKNGLVIDTNFLGSISKEPELYADKDLKYTVRKYLEVTCAKVKSKEVDGTAAELSKIAEDLIVLNEALNSGRTDSSTGVHDGPRKPGVEGKTPNGYKRPDWVDPVPTKAISK